MCTRHLPIPLTYINLLYHPATLSRTASGLNVKGALKLTVAEPTRVSVAFRLDCQTVASYLCQQKCCSS